MKLLVLNYLLHTVVRMLSILLAVLFFVVMGYAIAYALGIEMPFLDEIVGLLNRLFKASP